MSVAIPDEAGFLQCSRDNGYSRTRGAEHHRQELMAEFEFVAADAIVRHKKPAAASVLHRMKRHAGGRLHDQLLKTLPITQNAILEGAGSTHFLSKNVGADGYRIGIGNL